jgi:hypothetical protein
MRNVANNYREVFCDSTTNKNFLSSLLESERRKNKKVIYYFPILFFIRGVEVSSTTEQQQQQLIDMCFILPNSKHRCLRCVQYVLYDLPVDLALNVENVEEDAVPGQQRRQGQRGQALHMEVFARSHKPKNFKKSQKERQNVVFKESHQIQVTKPD